MVRAVSTRPRPPQGAGGRTAPAADAPSSVAATPNALGLTFPENGLALTVRVLLALTLLTPVVVVPGTIYPFVVGKALYGRVLIGAAFALWAVLALARPAWRPPRAPLLLLLGAWALTGVLSAAFGVSPPRSVWSYYPRMQGLFDQAHWIAFAVMATAMLKTPHDWRRMLCASQAVGLAAATLAIVHSYTAEGTRGTLDGPGGQVSALLGNPGYLGAYLQAVTLLAAGFLLRALASPPDNAAARRGKRRRPPPRKGGWTRWAEPAFHGLTLVLALWALTRAGSVGAALGAASGGAFGALALGFLAGGRTLKVALIGVAGSVTLAALVVGSGLAYRATLDEEESLRVFDNVLLRRATSPYDMTVSIGSRFPNWQAGLRAFAERPLLGWGPDNYLAAAGKHLAEDHDRYLWVRGKANPGRDHAHNTIIEEAATKGVVGLAAYLALWGWTLVVVLRTARRQNPRERALTVAVGAALLGWFVQSLTWFYFPSAWMVHMLLLAYLARREADPAAARPAAAPWRWARVMVGTAAVALAVGSLGVNRAVYNGAAALYRAETGGSGRFMVELEASMRAFEPMATHPRMLLFENVATNWPVLRERYPQEARRLLAWAEREAPRALATEPANWQLHHALAHLYREVSNTDPAYAGLAERFHASSRAVAPNLDPTLPLRYAD